MDKAEHAKGLTKIYVHELKDCETDFMRLIFKAAIRMLDNRVKPKAVEDWVVEAEKLFRKLLPTY